MSTGMLQTPPGPPDQLARWRMAALTVTVLLVAAVAVAVTLLVRTQGQQPSPTPPLTASGQSSAGESSSTQTQPSGEPSAPAATVTQLPPAAFGFQPLWPFAGAAEAEAWQRSYRSGGHQPWHLDARLTALSFTQGYLGYAGIDRVLRTTSVGTEAWVVLGWTDPNGVPAVAAELHLARIGTGQDAPWEVVGTRDTTVTLTRPAYGASVVPPLLVGGRITGVDESLSVQVRALGRPVLGQVSGIPAGGQDSPWSARVGFTAPPPGTVLTVAVSVGGGLSATERYAITGVRTGPAGPVRGGPQSLAVTATAGPAQTRPCPAPCRAGCRGCPVRSALEERTFVRCRDGRTCHSVATSVVVAAAEP